MLSTTNTKKALVFQLQGYHPFNKILYATLKVFGSEIMPYLKFPYSGSLFEKL